MNTGEYTALAPADASSTEQAKEPERETLPEQNGGKSPLANPSIVELNLRDIRIDKELQGRVQFLDEPTVKEYVKLLKAGKDLDPPEVFFDGKDYWLAHGFHRTEAYKRVGRTRFGAIVYPGSRAKALVYSLSANAKNSLRRTEEDKINVVLKAFGLALSGVSLSLEGEDTTEPGVLPSDSAIADICGVTQPFVSKLHRMLVDPTFQPYRTHLGSMALPVV